MDYYNEYSNKLTKELGKGYDQSNLKRMRQFYIMIEKGVAMPHFLTWSHIISLFNNKFLIEYKSNKKIVSREYVILNV